MTPPLPCGVESFTPLLQHSLNGFAVVDAQGRYVWVSDSLCLLLALDKQALLGRRCSALVFSDDRERLAALLAGARERAAANRPTDDFARLRHACGAGVARTGGADGASQRHIPVEIKACADAEYAYLVILDARVPTRLEGLLPDFLLSTSHDLRTPCCSLQAATAVLLTMGAVAADEDAVELLRAIDAACAVLLRCVSNVLHIRQLQRDGQLQLAPLQPCALQEIIARAVALVCAFGGDPPRVMWSEGGDDVAPREQHWSPPLPARVLVDAAALTACLQNVLLAAVRLGAWLPTNRSPVRLRVAAEPALALDVVQLHVTAHAGSGSDSGTAERDDTFHLIISAETPGRPLTRDEVDTLLSPFGMAPPDKGGGTGLALYVARGLARGMGGELVIESDRHDATFISVRLPLRVAPEGVPLPALSLAPPPASPGSSSSCCSVDYSSAGSEGPPAEAPCDDVELTARIFECLLTNSDDVFAICRLSPDKCSGQVAAVVEYISPAIERGLAFCQQAVVGASLLSVCVREDRPAFANAIVAAYRGDGPDGHHLTCMHRSMTATGGSVWCHTCGLCEGDVLYLVCRDVRARKSVELAMRAFTLATTHDVRECCNAVLVSAAVLERRDCITAAAAASPPASPEQLAAPSAAAAAAAAAAEDTPLEPEFLVACIRSACGLILGIVGNVLTAPQVEEGHVALETEIFSPKALLCDVMQACRLGCAAAAQPGGAAIEWEEPAEGAAQLPPLVEADCNRLAQVVQNVVTNGCKFSLGKTVTVCAELQPAAADADDCEARSWLVVRVRDRGRGMSADEAACCFLSGRAAPKAEGGGTGLGLYLSRAFAERMGGGLRLVASRPGGGSTFELRVPVRVLDAGELAAVAATEAAAAAAAADDARAARGRVAWCAAAAAATAAAAAAAGDGAAATSPTSSPSPTGSSTSSSSSTGAARSIRRFHVLLADDHVLNLRLVTRLLQLQHFDVTAVADGGAALDALCANALAKHPSAAAAAAAGDAALPTPPFDLAILDMNMPIKSGPDVAASFRQWEAATRPGAMRLPIIALTANVMEEHAAECATAGMNLFLSKPLRQCSIPVLRAHAAAYAEQRAVEEAARSATADAARAAAASAASAAVARSTLGLGALEPATHAR